MADDNEHSRPTWREGRNGNGSNGLSIPKWFMSVSTLVYALAVPWAIWVTNTLYHVKYQTEGQSQASTYMNQRMDKLSDQVRDLERRIWGGKGP